MIDKSIARIFIPYILINIFGFWMQSCSPQVLKKSSFEEKSVFKSYQESSQKPSQTRTLRYRNAVGPDRDRNEIGIFVAGDTMLDWGVKEVIQDKGLYYPGFYMRPLLKKFDYALANLETPVSGECEFVENKLFTFNARPEHLNSLSFMGLNGFVLANNHIGDCAQKGLVDTAKNLTRAGFNYGGIGPANPLKERKHIHIQIVNPEGEKEKISILSYGIKTPKQFRAGKKEGAYFPDMKIVVQEISYWRRRSDYLIVSVHWGTEYYDQPLAYQIRMAHAMIDQGADVVIGHHSHWVQAVEQYKHGMILYSLGNFLFGSNSPYLRNGYTAGLIFANKRLKRVEIYPIDTQNRGEARFQPRPLYGKGAQDILQHVYKLSAKRGTRLTIKGSMAYVPVNGEAEYYRLNHHFRWQVNQGKLKLQ